MCKFIIVIFCSFVFIILDATSGTRSSKIIRNSKIEDYPYQLSLEFIHIHVCGAAIIGENWAVTSAFCTEGFPESMLAVRAGSTKIRKGGQLIPVQKIYSHPNYNSTNRDFDISVLELKSNIKLGKFASIIELDDGSTELEDGTNATISGWLDITAPQLQSATIPIVDQDSCQKIYNASKTQLNIEEEMICAKYYVNGNGICISDVGGPLVVDGKLCGIVSWVIGCLSPDHPGIFTRISAVRDFIAQVTEI